jgi:hypothetical protein
VSGRGGSGPGKQSGMPRECAWITASVEARSKGGCTSFIQIVGVTAIGDRLAIDEDGVGTFFLSDGVHTCLRVTVESISVGEIGTSR